MTSIGKKLAAIAAACVMALPMPQAAASAQSSASDDKNIIAARRHFFKDKRKSFERAAAAVEQGSVYQPLLRYWRAVFHLRANRTAPMSEFVAIESSPYLRDTGRRQLLEYFAKKKLWRPFVRYAKSPRAPVCARLLEDFSNSRGAVLRQWQTDVSFSDSLCAALYKHAHQRNVITSEMIWRKIRDISGERQISATRRLMRIFPGRHRYADLRHVVNNARTYLAGRHKLSTRRNRELLMIAAAVSVRGNPKNTISRWRQFDKYFTPSENAFVYAKLAEWAARWRLEDALGLYHRADAFAARAEDRPQVYDENARAWRVRAALLDGKFATVLAIISTMPAEEQEISAWRYWRAVALARRGEAITADILMRELARDEDDFYGLLARQESGLPLMNEDETSIVINEKANADNAIAPASGDFALALALRKAGANDLARRIWRAAVRDEDADKTEIRNAANAADRQRWFLASIDAAEYLGGPRKLRFPTPFAREVLGYSRKFGLDAAFVYGLIRQESRFMPKIKSSAGASGLMQLMPLTASRVARRHGYNKYNKSRLTRANVNVILGTTYLSDLSKLLKNQAPLVAAGYNAGPLRARRWRRGGAADVPWPVFVENIPITETRLYVKHLLANRAHYDEVLSRKGDRNNWISRAVARK